MGEGVVIEVRDQGVKRQIVSVKQSWTRDAKQMFVSIGLNSKQLSALATFIALFNTRCPSKHDVLTHMFTEGPFIGRAIFACEQGICYWPFVLKP